MVMRDVISGAGQSASSMTLPAGRGAGQGALAPDREGRYGWEARLRRQMSAIVSAALFSAALHSHGALAAPKERIADAWYAHNAVLLMLGAAPQVVATVVRPAAFPWMFRVAPELSHAELVQGATLNAEELIRQKADVVFMTPDSPSEGALRRAGLNVVSVGFTDFDSLLQSIDVTVQALDTPLARERAHDYRAYLEQTIAEVSQGATTEPVRQRPRVLHVASLDPLKIDGADTIIDQWIKTAGGCNAATGLHGNLQTVSIEQVLAWNPDIIILAANAGNIDTSRQASIWSELDAVKRHRVYRNPDGVFPWDRYGPEVALQLRWAAQVLKTGRPDDASLIVQTRQFYTRFFGYALTVDEAKRILQGLPPP